MGRHENDRQSLRFRSLKKSEMVVMKAFERQYPAKFREHLLSYLISNSARDDTRTAVYRIQNLGEFIGEMIPEERLARTKVGISKLQLEHVSDEELQLVFRKFLEGTKIGVSIANRFTRTRSGSKYRQIAIKPNLQPSY